MCGVGGDFCTWCHLDPVSFCSSDKTRCSSIICYRPSRVEHPLPFPSDLISVVCFWVVCSVPTVCLSSPAPRSHGVNYYNLMMCMKMKKTWELSRDPRSSRQSAWSSLAFPLSLLRREFNVHFSFIRKLFSLFSYILCIFASTASLSVYYEKYMNKALMFVRKAR